MQGERYCYTMPMAAANPKHQAYELLDRLDAGQLAAVIHLLQVMTDPVAHAIANAPVDDEPMSANGIKALDEARGWSKRNDLTPHEQVLAELGITKEEIDRDSEKR
jgi:hypothetical protein